MARDAAIIGMKQRQWAEKVDSNYELTGTVSKAKENTISDPQFCQVVCSLGDFTTFGYQLDEIMGARKDDGSGKHEK